MKKTSLLLLAGILLTGCGKIKCVNGSNGEKIVSVAKFKGKYLVNETITTTIDTDSSLEFNQICDITKASFTDKNYKVTCKNRVISIEHSMDFKKSDKITKEKYEKQYKENGYKCK